MNDPAGKRDDDAPRPERSIPKPLEDSAPDRDTEPAPDAVTARDPGSLPSSSSAPVRPDPTRTARPPGARRRRPMRRLVWMLLGASAAIWLVLELPAEIARWYLAAAQVHVRHGRLGPAESSLSNAARWDPRNAWVHATAAVLRQRRGEHDKALESADRLVELLPDDMSSYELRADILNRMGRHRREVEDRARVVELFQRSFPPGQRRDAYVWSRDPYNSLAYAKAVADFDIEGGLRDIERSIEGRTRFERENLPEKDWNEPDHAVLDTRGYLLYRAGRHEEALRDMNEAIAKLEKQLAKWDPYRDASSRRVKEQVEQLNKSAAVLYYHRMLIHEELDQLQLREEDYRRVLRRYGKPPDDELH